MNSVVLRPVTWRGYSRVELKWPTHTPGYFGKFHSRIELGCSVSTFQLHQHAHEKIKRKHTQPRISLVSLGQRDRGRHDDCDG